MKHLLYLSGILLALIFCVTPVSTLADNHCGENSDIDCPPPLFDPGDLNSRPDPPAASNGDSGQKLQNPLAFNDIQSFLVAIINVAIIILTPIVILFIILAGFKYVTARGNASQVEEATKALTYAVIGGVLIIGALAIAEIIRNLVTSFQAI